MMTKWIKTAFVTVMVTFSSLSFANQLDAKNPYTLMAAISDEMFSQLRNEKNKYQANPELLRGVVEKDLMPYINARYAALKVLGPLATQATKEQRDEFSDAFSKYLVTTYAQVLTRYTDQKVVVESPKPIDASRTITSVNVEILDGGQPPINLNFRFRKNSRTEEWQAFDVQVEGVSMLDTKTSELRGPLRQQGIEKVAQELIKLANAPITKE